MFVNSRSFTKTLSWEASAEGSWGTQAAPGLWHMQDQGESSSYESWALGYRVSGSHSQEMWVVVCTLRLNIQTPEHPKLPCQAGTHWYILREAEYAERVFSKALYWKRPRVEDRADIEGKKNKQAKAIAAKVPTLNTKHQQTNSWYTESDHSKTPQTQTTS